MVLGINMFKNSRKIEQLEKTIENINLAITAQINVNTSVSEALLNLHKRMNLLSDAITSQQKQLDIVLEHLINKPKLTKDEHV